MRSHVLRAMKVDAERARASMRFSFGRYNTEAEVDKALEIIPEVISKLRQYVVRVGRAGTGRRLAGDALLARRARLSVH